MSRKGSHATAETARIPRKRIVEGRKGGDCLIQFASDRRPGCGPNFELLTTRRGASRPGRRWAPLGAQPDIEDVSLQEMAETFDAIKAR
jgi:hypothetical protein